MELDGATGPYIDMCSDACQQYLGVELSPAGKVQSFKAPAAMQTEALSGRGTFSIQKIHSLML